MATPGHENGAVTKWEHQMLLNTRHDTVNNPVGAPCVYVCVRACKNKKDGRFLPCRPLPSSNQQRGH